MISNRQAKEREQLKEQILSSALSVFKKHGIEKNVMHLVSLEEQKRILSALELEKFSIKFAPGGSAANSMIGLSQLGGNAAFGGKIGMDEHGVIYKKKLEELRVNSSKLKLSFILVFLNKLTLPFVKKDV